MKLSIVRLDGKREQLDFPPPGSRFVQSGVAHGDCANMTLCWTRPWQIQGEGWTDTYVTEALCSRCSAPLGVFELVMETLFGVREDEAVLNSRARVY